MLSEKIRRKKNCFFQFLKLNFFSGRILYFLQAFDKKSFFPSDCENCFEKNIFFPSDCEFFFWKKQFFFSIRKCFFKKLFVDFSRFSENKIAFFELKQLFENARQHCVTSARKRFLFERNAKVFLIG